MLYALASPFQLLGLLLGFVAAVCLHGAVQARLLARAGQPAALRGGAGSFSPRTHLDPFGGVLAAFGVGYGRPLEVDTRPHERRTSLDVALLAPAVLLVVLGGLAVVGVMVVGGLVLPTGAGLVPVLRGDLVPAAVPLRVAFGAAASLMLVGLLHLVPIPPLDAGRVLLLHGGTTAGWQRFRGWFEESQWGLLVLLLLTIINLGARPAPLLFVLDTVTAPVVTLASTLAGGGG